MDLSNQETANKIIRQCLEGDRKAQHLLYTHFYQLGKRVCSRYAQNSEEAEDFMHTGFLKVFENLPNYQFRGSLEGWVRKIFVNNSLNLLRRRKKYLLIPEDEMPVAVDAVDSFEFEEEDIIKADADIVLRIIQGLPDLMRIVVNLIVFEQMSHKEIGDLLGIAVGTSKSTYFRAREKIVSEFKRIKNSNENQ